MFLGRDPLDRRQRRRTRTVVGTKRDAQRALAAFVAEVDRSNRSTTDMTVDELVERWLAHRGDDLSPTTLRGYRRILDKRIRPAFGSTSIHHLKVVDLDAFYLALRTEAGLAPAASARSTP